MQLLKKWKFFVSLFLILSQGYCFGNQTVRIDNTNNKPRVSIITSIWNGDEFIEGFLADITRQTIFSDCELLLINANSPGNEEVIIKKYMEQYPNIRYVKLENDPGIYGVWNIGVKMASSDLLTNANIDDRRHPEQLAIHVGALNARPKVDLVYSGHYLTSFPNETFENNRHHATVNHLLKEFSPRSMHLCLPGPLPTWRKSMHDSYGFFDESFVSMGDWEFWNRAVSQGSVFHKICGVYGLMYLNPQGLSTDMNNTKALQRKKENDRIVSQYRVMWGWPNPGNVQTASR